MACPPAHVQPSEGQASCLRCSEDGSVDCDDPAVVRVMEGFYLEDVEGFAKRNRDLRAFQCPMTAGCIGGPRANESCADGYEGPLCGTCTLGYYRSSTSCKECSEMGAIALLRVVITLGVVGFLFALYLCGDALSKSQRRYCPSLISWCARLFSGQLGTRITTLMKIMIGWHQSLMVITMFPQLSLPEELAEALRSLQEALAVINLDIFSLVPLECISTTTRVNFGAKLVGVIVMPLALLQGLLILAVISAVCMRRPLRSIWFSPRLSRLGFWLLLLLYPLISRTMFATFIWVSGDLEGRSVTPSHYTSPIQDTPSHCTFPLHLFLALAIARCTRARFIGSCRPLSPRPSVPTSPFPSHAHCPIYALPSRPSVRPLSCRVPTCMLPVAESPCVPNDSTPKLQLRILLAPHTSHLTCLRRPTPFTGFDLTRSHSISQPLPLRRHLSRVW